MRLIVKLRYDNLKYNDKILDDTNKIGRFTLNGELVKIFDNINHLNKESKIPIPKILKSIDNYENNRIEIYKYKYLP